MNCNHLCTVGRSPGSRATDAAPAAEALFHGTNASSRDAPTAPEAASAEPSTGRTSTEVSPGCSTEAGMDGGESALAAAGRCTLASVETPVRFACAPMSYGRRNHDAIRALFAALALAEALGLPREELPTSGGLLADESPGGCLPEGSLRPRLGFIGVSAHMSKHACHFGSSACSCINAANLARILLNSTTFLGEPLWKHMVSIPQSPAA